MIILTIKGNSDQAKVAAEAHGITLAATVERRSDSDTYTEALVRPEFERAAQSWYVAQDHRTPYLAGALLWYRKQLLTSEIRRRA